MMFYIECIARLENVAPANDGSLERVRHGVLAGAKGHGDCFEVVI